MPLSAEAVHRLNELGLNSPSDRRRLELVWSDGGDSAVRRWLDLRQAAHDGFQTWLPRLQAYVAACRHDRPLPILDSFSAVEREHYRIFLEKMADFKRTKVEGQEQIWKDQIILLESSLIGLAAANIVFGAIDSRDYSIALLLEEEKSRWFAEVYRGSAVCYGFWRWNVDLTVPKRVSGSLASTIQNAIGEGYWVVSAGLGDRTRYETWRWDGVKAEPTDVFWIEGLS